MAFPLVKYMPVEPKLDFFGARKFFFALSILMVVASVALIFTKGLNFGVDFRGGIVMEVQTDGPAATDDLRSELNALGLGDVQLQTFGSPDVVLINVPLQEGDEGAQQAAVQAIQDTIGDAALEYRRVESVGPKVGDELKTGGIIATVLSMLGIAIYVWVRFDLSYGLAALVALLHDVIATVGFFSLTGIEFNLATLAAILTVAGYSINDTVVIFDRVREELRRYKRLPVPEVLNKAMNATLTRTTLTSLTTLLALFGLFIFGGEVIRGFSAGIIFGIVIGTYSSWGCAVPLLAFFRLRPAATAPKGVEGEGTADPEADAEPGDAQQRT